MTYQYNYRTTAFDLWQLSMYYIYGSIAGVCNIVFTLAMLGLTWSKWNTAAAEWQILMLLGCLFFPVIQPIIIYKKVQRQAANMSQATEITIYDTGIHVALGEQSSEIAWKSVGGILKKRTMLILLSDKRHGFILANRVLGNEKEELYTYVKTKIAQN